MRNFAVRIESVEIINFKNVRYGFLSFENPQKKFHSSILGLYGQNGSGKTALIDALELLRFALSGKAVPACFADYINVGSEYATIKYGFKIQNLKDDVYFSVLYEVSIRRDKEDSGQNTEQFSDNVLQKVTLFNEVLSCAYKWGETKSRFSYVIDTRTDNDIFLPKSKYKKLVGNSKETAMDLLVAKQLTRTSSRSFVFSRELLNIIRQNCKEEQYLFLMESLAFFGNYELFVITTRNTGLISMDALPLAFNYAEEGKISTGSILVNLNGPSLIPEDALPIVRKVVKSMNIVLERIVPNLTIDIKDLGTQLSTNGIVGSSIQLVSNKNDKEIPLQYESDGIKKLISVLQLLIVIYNKSSITVAIDELDSGIFEYLLGEILRIISEKGKGQLIFTSHSLRPLETLDKGFIAFTTTNPLNRYIRMSNVKATNNLRDFYYRDIVLGEQCEPVYESTNNSEIALAFREAGICDAT